MSEEEKQIFNKMIYCNLINGEQALKFNRKYEDLQQKVEQLENIRKEAIKYVQEKADYPISYYHCLNDLLNILNKGEKK